MMNTIRTLRQHLAPGLHKLTVETDARDFDWESLYFNLNQFGNVNQRTGPWDFDLRDGNTPLVPAYWVSLNGRPLGLWYFNRPSFRQVRNRQLRGEACFWIESAGEHELRFEPYRTATIEWTTSRLEPSPDDRLLESVTLRPGAQRGLQRLFPDARWRELARQLTAPGFSQGDALREGFARALSRDDVRALPLLVAAARLQNDAAALARARQIIEQLLAQPTWGNPRADGYGHNGDMMVADTILALTYAVNFLTAELGAELANAILARLERQGTRFIEMALLQHGYWGGSVLQDHGYKSFGHFTTAAYGLVGWLPSAERWLRFCLPRIERTLRALPADGAIPTTSYHHLSLYVGKLILLRELHLQARDEDLYDRPAFRQLTHYCRESYDEPTGQLLRASARGDLTPLAAGQAFFGQMARTFGDADAAWLARECRRNLARLAPEAKDYEDLLLAALLPAAPEAERSPQPPRRLSWFRDSGTIVYRDDARGLLFSTHCGPPNSVTSYQNAPGPCDRILFAHQSGNFAIARHGRPLIHTAEGGYRMRTELGNVVLVDGRGQWGDDNFAMGYPDAAYGGEFIEAAALPSADATGKALLQLGPAYDPAQEIERHTREWFFEPDGRLRMVDTITARQPHRFTWLFHTYERHAIISQPDGGFKIQNGDATLTLRLAHSSTPLRSAVAKTLIVWGYRNDQGNQGFQHLEFTSADPAREMRAEFVLR